MPAKYVKFGLGAAAALALATSAALAEPPKVLNFGIISTESSQNLKTGFEPFLKDMETALGIPVKAFFAPDYAGVIEAMRFNKVHIAWFGNKSAMEAVDRAEGEIFVQTVDVTGNPGYWSLLITHKDNSELNKVDDVLKCDKSLNFGNGDPNSTSGFLVPSFYVFAQRNVDPRECFKLVRNASHEANALAVANKQVHVATNNTESMSRMQANHPKAFENVKIIWKSPLIPSDPIVWRKDLDRDFKAKVKAFFLAYGRLGPNAAAEREKLAKVSSGWAPFHDSSNDQLLPIRQLELAKNKAKLEKDDRMSTTERTQKIAAIEKQLATLKVISESKQ